QRFAPGRTDIGPDTPIEALGLSSLERVELLMAIEEHAQTTIDESAFAEATTIGDLATLAGEGAARATASAVPSATSADGLAAPKSTASGSAAPKRAAAATAEDGPVTFPTWNRRWPFTWVRNVSLPTWILP